MEKELLSESLLQRFEEIAILGVPDDSRDHILPARYVCPNTGVAWYPIAYHPRAGILIWFREKHNQLVFGIFMIGILLRGSKPMLIPVDMDNLSSEYVERDYSFTECKLWDLGIPLDLNAAKGKYNFMAQLKNTLPSESHFITIDRNGVS